MLPCGIVLCVIGIVLLALWNIRLILSQKARKQKMVLCVILPLIFLAMVYLGTSLVRAEVRAAVQAEEESALFFDTPEEAFHYKYPNRIWLILEGNESTLVIPGDMGSSSWYSGAILPKTEEGWNPANWVYRNEVARVFSRNHGEICLLRYKKTNDFYLAIYYLGSTPGELFDNKGTDFLNSSGNVLSKEPLHRGFKYFAFVDGIDENYVLTIDGEEFTFPNVK